MTAPESGSSQAERSIFGGGSFCVPLWAVWTD